MNKKFKYLLCIWLFSAVLLISFSFTNVTGDEQLSLTYYGKYGCSICHVKHELIQNFVAQHPEIDAKYLWIPINISVSEYYGQLNALGEPSPPPPPTLVLNRSNEIVVYYSINITTDNLESWRLGEPPQNTEFTMGIAFITGLITGISACMLLLLSVLGTSLTTVESRGKYFIISAGLIIGLICAYLGVSVLFLVTINAFNVITYLKYIFGGILLFLGIWQIIEFRRERSIIFGTSNRIKSLLKNFIEKRSGIYAFLVGLIFAFIKIPCFGGPYLQLLFFSQTDPLLWVFIIFYFLGLLLPIIVILLAIRIGFRSEKVDRFRLEYRPHLRLLSGCFLITLTIYLFFDTYISLAIVLWIILAETIIFALIIWIKSRKLQKQKIQNVETNSI